jgi:chromosome segregation ATPase
MKLKVAIIVLVIGCLGLAIGLFATKKQADDQHTQDLSNWGDMSNQLVSVNVQLKDLSQVNLALTNDLASSRQESLDLSNSLSTANQTLADTKTTLASAQNQITNLNVQVTDLEVQNKVLDQRASELTNTIAQLNALIASTETKLSIAETNTAFLQGELQKQMAQKSELEHKFNDVNEVRAQVKKLRDEMFIARHIQLSKTDTGKKGAELLTSRAAATPSTNGVAKAPSNYDLNVEVGSDGSVKVIPPLSNSNAPAH